MTLKEVGIVIGKKLVTRRRPIRSSPVIVSFRDTEVKHRRTLVSSYGQGSTAKEAKTDYCTVLKGRILITDAMLKTRKEIQLPPMITVK